MIPRLSWAIAELGERRQGSRATIKNNPAIPLSRWGNPNKNPLQEMVILQGVSLETLRLEVFI